MILLCPVQGPWASSYNILFSTIVQGDQEIRVKVSIFSLPEPKALVSYCHSAPSVVRPSVCLSVCPSSVRKLFIFSTSSPEPLDGFWWNLVGMKYSWSQQVLLFFGQIRPGRIQGGAKIGHRGSPSRNFFFRSDGYSDKPNASQWALLFLGPSWSQIFDAFLTSFWT